MPGDGYGIAKADGVVAAYPRIPVSQPSLNKVSRLIEFTPAGGDPRLLAFVSVPLAYEDIYLYDSSGESWSLLVHNEPRSLDWFIAGGKLYWLNGSKLRVYDGVSVTDAALTPAGSAATAAETAVWDKVCRAVAVEQRGQRWFFATAGNEVIFSEVGDPTAFDPVNIININTRNGDGITALHEFNNGLLIFKKHSVHYLAGWDFAGGSDIQLHQLNVSSGTAFPETVRTVDNGVIYLGINGLYRLSLPNYASVVAAHNISAGRINRRLYEEGVITEAIAVVWDNAYYLSILQRRAQESDGTASGQPVSLEYRYLTARDSFFGEFTMPTSCYAVGLGGEAGLFIGTYNGYVLRYDHHSRTYLDPLSGEPCAIDAEACTKCYDIAGALAQEVRVEKLEVAARQYAAESSDLTVTAKADYDEQRWDAVLDWAVDGDESLVYGEGLLGEAVWGWQDTVTKELLLRRRCKRLQFIVKSNSDQPLLVYGVALLYHKKRVKGSRRGVTQNS